MTITSPIGTQAQGRTLLGVASETADKGADYTILAADRSKLIRFTGAGPWTATLTTSATLGSQFVVYIRNDSALDLTIDTTTGNINGGPTVTVEPGLAVMVFCNGTDCFTFGYNLNPVPLIGGTMTGALILSGDPVTALGAATKQYVDAIASGIAVQPSCYAATTANLNATQAGAGAGATLTNAGAMAAFSVDGVSPPLNSRILVKDQTLTQHNGCYTLTTVGSGAVNWVLTRATDYDTAAEIQPGTLFIVSNGTANALTSWIETEVVVTVDTDPVLFTQFTTSPANFANIQLSNLGTTSVNADIIPNAGGTRFLGSLTVPWAALFAQGLLATTGNGDQAVLGAYDGATVAYKNFFTVTSSAAGSATGVIASDVTATTQAANNNSTKVATTAYADNQVTANAANKLLSNLTAGSVAVNTSLVSDTDITDDLGSSAIRWRDIYSSTLRTGDTAADTLVIGARDVDGASWTPFITLTANNTPSCVLASGVTATTQAANDNSTKLATTAYVDSAVTGGSGSWILLGTATAAASATIDFTSSIDGTYDEYAFAFTNVIPVTNNVGFWIRLRSGGVFRSTAGDYAWGHGFYSTAPGGVNSTSSTQIELASTLNRPLSNSSTKGASGLIYLGTPASTTTHKRMWGTYNFWETLCCGSYFGGWLIGVTTAVDGVRFMMSSGNISSGEFQFYGIKKV